MDGHHDDLLIASWQHGMSWSYAHINEASCKVDIFVPFVKYQRIWHKRTTIFGLRTSHSENLCYRTKMENISMHITSFLARLIMHSLAACIWPAYNNVMFHTNTQGYLNISQQSRVYRWTYVRPFIRPQYSSYDTQPANKIKCLYITPSHYHHCANLSEDTKLIKCLSDIFCRVCE